MLKPLATRKSYGQSNGLTRHPLGPPARDQQPVFFFYFCFLFFCFFVFVNLWVCPRRLSNRNVFTYLLSRKQYSRCLQIKLSTKCEEWLLVYSCLIFDIFDIMNVLVAFFYNTVFRSFIVTVFIHLFFHRNYLWGREFIVFRSKMEKPLKKLW